MYTINVSLHAHGQDDTVAVWDMISPMDIFLRKELRGHTGVWAVDFDENYIVSGSYDQTIKVRVGEGREREGWRGRKGRRRQRRRGTSIHPLSSCLNFLIIKLTPYTAQKIPISL